MSDLKELKFRELFYFGMPTRGDAVVTSMTAKAEANKERTSILPGDFVAIVKEEDGTNIEKIEKVPNDQMCCTYGVATFGISGFCVPVVIKGHVIANIPTTFSPEVGKYLGCKDADCTCCKIFVLRKLKVKKAGATGVGTDAYEVVL